MLSAAFNIFVEGFGPAPKELFIGLDSREIIHAKDTMENVGKFEPTLASYKRIPVKTAGGFLSEWMKPQKATDEFGDPEDKVFTLHAKAEFSAIGGEIGKIHNYFLTTAESGIDGKLLVSSPLKHSFDFHEDYRLGVELVVSLREVEWK